MKGFAVQNRRPEPQGDAEQPRPASVKSHEENLIFRREGTTLLDIGLIQDHETISRVRAETSSAGQLLVCHGCSDVEAAIVGLLVLDEDQQAWALCGTCVGKLLSIIIRKSPTFII
jgi:hypothetical protein